MFFSELKMTYQYLQSPSSYFRILLGLNTHTMNHSLDLVVIPSAYIFRFSDDRFEVNAFENYIWKHFKFSYSRLISMLLTVPSISSMIVDTSNQHV